MRLHGVIIANKHILSTKFLKYRSQSLKIAFPRTKVDYRNSADLLNKSKTDAIKDIIPVTKENLIFDNNYYSVIQKY